PYTTLFRSRREGSCARAIEPIGPGRSNAWSFRWRSAQARGGRFADPRSLVCAREQRAVTRVIDELKLREMLTTMMIFGASCQPVLSQRHARNQAREPATGGVRNER